MEPTVIAALITAVAVVVAAFIQFRAKSPASQDDVSEKLEIADIRGQWVASTNASHDLINIENQNGRSVSGIRRFRGKDKTERSYIVTGYFDGMLLSLAATSTEASETRTLSIVLKRKTGTRFVGVRTHLSNNKIYCTRRYEWIKQG